MTMTSKLPLCKLSLWKEVSCININIDDAGHLPYLSLCFLWLIHSVWKFFKIVSSINKCLQFIKIETFFLKFTFAWKYETLLVIFVHSVYKYSKMSHIVNVEIVCLAIFLKKALLHPKIVYFLKSWDFFKDFWPLCCNYSDMLSRYILQNS